MSNHAIFLAGLIGGGVSTLGRGTGAHRIATILRKESWDVEVLDFVLSWSNDQLFEFFKSRITSDTKIIGYSYTFHTWNDRLHLIFDWIKKEHPSIKIIVGGIGVETCPLDAHFYINGYAEYAVFEVIKYLNGTLTNKLKYTLHRNGKLIRANSDYPAYPIRDLRVSFEDRDFIDSRETLVIETCRGCIFKCSFCTYPILGIKDDHTISAESYIAHLKEDYERWGVTHWNLADETFNDRSDKIEKFANATANLDFKPNLTSFMRADLMISRKADWPLLEAMGLWGHWYGIESFNHPSAKSIGKGMDSERIKEGLLEVKDYFQSQGPYKGTMSFIIGLPFETEETVRQSWDWLKENWAGQSVNYYGLFIPNPKFTEETSSFSFDWQKKGYRKINNIDVTNNLSKNKTDISLIWENDYLNYAKSHELVKEFYQIGAKYFSVDNFTMVKYRLAFDKSEDWLNIPVGENQIEEKANTASDQFQQNYILKKLNYKK